MVRLKSQLKIIKHNRNEIIQHKKREATEEKCFSFNTKKNFPTEDILYFSNAFVTLKELMEQVKLENEKHFLQPSQTFLSFSIFFLSLPQLQHSYTFSQL